MAVNNYVQHPIYRLTFPFYNFVIDADPPFPPNPNKRVQSKSTATAQTPNGVGYHRSSSHHHVFANPYRASAIVPTLTSGSTVVATRASVHYVVMEYGIIHFFGKTLRQRAHALVQIQASPSRSPPFYHSRCRFVIISPLLELAVLLASLQGTFRNRTYLKKSDVASFVLDYLLQALSSVRDRESGG
ncbi:unnamed protein product [Taenia asiatica]|uniref:AcetylCoA_hyd_C domain-containing protein n=1 Tax=Taenia asiatica TaxID=60517 RepID=A0A0R3W9H1_TAEAS|nr:unnamed protein product [Taenia asiatica]